MELQIIIDLTPDHRPTSRIFIELICAKVFKYIIGGNIGKCGLKMDLKATTGHCETLGVQCFADWSSKSIWTLCISIQFNKKHDTEEAHLYVRGKPPTAVASEKPLPIFLYSLY